VVARTLVCGEKQRRRQKHMRMREASLCVYFRGKKAAFVLAIMSGKKKIRSRRANKKEKMGGGR